MKFCPSWTGRNHAMALASVMGSLTILEKGRSDMIDLDDIVENVKDIGKKLNSGKEKSMPVASSLGSGLAFGAANALSNNLAGDATDHIVNALHGLFKNESVREAMKGIAGVAKQNLPKFGGFGVVEEAEFYSTLNLLSLEDQHRVKRVVVNIRQHSEKHIQRFWMILATKKVEGVTWDPHGPAIIPSLRRATESDVWGLPKDGKKFAKGAVPAEGTPADTRVIALQNLADMVRTPPVAGIQGDSEEAVASAAEHLRETILRDYHFYSFLVKWWKEADDFRGVLERSGNAVKEQLSGILLFWVASEIGRENLQDILNTNEDVDAKRAAIEACLVEAVAAKKKKIFAKQLTRGPARPFLTFALLLTVGILLVSADSVGELIIRVLIAGGLGLAAFVLLRLFKLKTNQKEAS